MKLRYYSIKKMIVIFIVKVNGCYGTEIQQDIPNDELWMYYVYVCEHNMGMIPNRDFANYNSYGHDRYVLEHVLI